MLGKQTEANKEIKQKERKQTRENMVEEIDLGGFFELATTNKRCVFGLNLHEIKNEFLDDYRGDFETISNMLVGEMEQKTNIRL